MSMRLGQHIRTTLFGESHGSAVGALLEGLPPGTVVDTQLLLQELERRRPGDGISSLRKETDECEILSGVHDGRSTGGPILLLIRNRDKRSSDYSFLPYHPRPGHADLPAYINSRGFSDLRGGGENSARLTAGLVAAAALSRSLLDEAGISILAHVCAIGGESTTESPAPVEGDEAVIRTRCSDTATAEKMLEAVLAARASGDSLGSAVEVSITGLPLGFGANWFMGLEPVLAHGLMSIPGARAVEFGHGVECIRMKGSDHNSPWYLKDGEIGTDGDGALGGMATGAPLRIRLSLKPPSSIAMEQDTLNLKTGEMEQLRVGGRHDPVLGPRAVPVAEAVCTLIIADMLQEVDADE